MFSDINIERLIEIHSNIASKDDCIAVELERKESRINEEYEAYELLLDGFCGLEADEFLKSLESYEHKHSFESDDKKIRPINFRKFLSVAASIMLIVCAGLIFQFNADNSEKIYSDYIEFNDYIDLSVSRSDDLVSSANYFFKEGEYLKSIKLYEQYLISEEIDETISEEVRLKIGIAQLKTAQYDKSLMMLRLLKKETFNKDLKEDCDWYIFLNNIMTTDIQEVIQELDTLKLQSTKYQDKYMKIYDRYKSIIK